MVKILRFSFILSLFILGACASKMKDQMREYREAFARGDYQKANELLDKSELKKDKKSALLWLLEKGTVALASQNENEAIAQFSEAIELIDRLYTKSLSSKTASFLINDASDVFYGASYERSYAHYFLARAYYSRFYKSQNKSDLQSARATILAWDSYFTELQRASTLKTLYQTDLMLKVFGGQIHEVSEIKNDTQIALQLYKDALRILDLQGAMFPAFNTKSSDYIRGFQKMMTAGNAPSDKVFDPTASYSDLKNFLHYKVLSLTRDVRNFDFDTQVKTLKPSPEVLQRINEGRSNVVLVLEEGVIPQKVARPFNFGLKGAVNAIDNPGAKAFINTVGAEVLTAFAMNKLGMYPSNPANTGSFIFAHDVTRLAVQEAAIEFELPMIETVPPLKRLEVFILDDKGKIITQTPLPIVTANGDIAKVVLEEDAVSRYVKTGTRIAVKHLAAIVSAMQVYRTLHKGGDDGDFLAKSAAMATYIGASKGIAAMEKADVRHWTTLPTAFRMAELKLPAGNYQVGVSQGPDIKSHENAMVVVGHIQVASSGKTIHYLKLP